MSALERFVRARRFRARAADYFELAADEVGLDIRARYLAVADHYTALADHELRSDRLERKKRLEEMGAARDKRAGRDRVAERDRFAERDRVAERERGAERDWNAAAARAQSVDATSFRAPPPVKLRVIQGQAGDSRKQPQPPTPLSGSILARPVRRKYSRHAW
jgi:hypothetical protein